MQRFSFFFFGDHKFSVELHGNPPSADKSHYDGAGHICLKVLKSGKFINSYLFNEVTAGDNMRHEADGVNRYCLI